MRALALSRKILYREIVLGRIATYVVGLFCFVILTALGAYVRIPLPFTPVPITLQTFFVLLSGAVLGRKWGAASQASYLLLGALGLPIFAAAGSGVAYLFGPTGGYIVGFVITSWLTGTFIQSKNGVNLSRVVLAMLISSFLGIYFLGILGLIVFLKCNLSRALSLGLFPFILGDTLKIISASVVFCKIEKRCKELFDPCSTNCLN